MKDFWELPYKIKWMTRKEVAELVKKPKTNKPKGK